eukprot:3929653-Alexandrium_andersonii.AAC.1
MSAGCRPPGPPPGASGAPGWQPAWQSSGVSRGEAAPWRRPESTANCMGSCAPIAIDCADC